VEYDNGEILKTRVARIQKELEYHIKLVEYLQDPNAVDLCSDSMRRTTNMLDEIGVILIHRTTILLQQVFLIPVNYLHPYERLHHQRQNY